jgi:hypothetical protein
MKNNIFGVTLFILCFFILVSKVNGQKQTKLNTVYFELGGNGLFSSINYERQLFKTVRLNFHVGTGIYGVKQRHLTVPFGLNYLIKLNKSNSFIDLGFGATYIKADVKLYLIVDNKNSNQKGTNYWNYIPSVAYRKLTKRNLMYRFSLTPVINQYGLLPFLGFSIGKSF